MRLLIPFIIIVLGATIGLIVNTVLNGREDVTDVRPYLSMFAGGIGAFVGMFLRDTLGIQMVGNLTDTVIASALGAAAFAAIAHVILRSRR